MTPASETSASYASLLVHFDLSPYAASRGQLATWLADRFQAHLIGIAAEKLLTPVYSDMTSNLSSFSEGDENERVHQDLEAARKAFFGVVTTRNNVEWRSANDDPELFLLEQSRAADLIVLGRRASYDDGDPRLGVSPGDVVMGCGRPVLVVPPETEELSAKVVVVAWKDTREARRAVSDAMPFLKEAEEVFVVTADKADRARSAEDVANYLARHGVNCRPVIRCGQTASIAEEILETAREMRADLIVAGAYGHSRTREWIFGGATRDLLETTNVCLMLSH